MPLKNRVTPFGEIVAVPERGTMMGNRGILHDAAQRLRRRWAGRLWICCLLEFRGRREPVMAPGHYTRLFFLDEPTALAAGHRPCAYCRRPAYQAFQAAWGTANAHLGLGPKPHAAEIDRVLHEERLGPGGAKRLHRAELASLPDGVYVTPDRGASLVVPGEDRPGFLLWKGERWRWSHGGYAREGSSEPGPGPEPGSVLVLTPPSIVAALADGYRPEPPAGLRMDRG